MPVLSPKLLPCLSALPLITTLLMPSAHADTYKLYTVASTQSESFVMGDDYGNYAINSSLVNGTKNLCGTSYLNSCYQVGNAITGASYFSSTIPAPAADPYPRTGTADVPSGSGWDLYKQLGNIFSGSYTFSDGSEKRGLWDGSDPVTDYLGSGSIDGGFASANGNVFFIDGIDNTLVVGIDLQTSPVPEPGTLSLTATALVAAVAFGRRRLMR